jgi:hypothetical protein
VTLESPTFARLCALKEHLQVSCLPTQFLDFRVELFSNPLWRSVLNLCALHNRSRFRHSNQCR